MTAAKNDLAVLRPPNAGPRRLRPKRTAERPFSKTEIKIAKRRKHNCWARKIALLKELYKAPDYRELKEDRPTVKDAARKVRMSSDWAAWRFI